MANRGILAIDQGTTSTRSVVYDAETLLPLAASQKEIRQYFPQDGWVEHDAEEIWRTVAETVQEAMIDDMVFSVAQIVSICSQFMTLEPGDVIVTGTPSGVGLDRKPQLFMKDGDVCEVEIDQLGVLSNPVRDRLRPALAKTA